MSLYSIASRYGTSVNALQDALIGDDERSVESLTEAVQRTTDLTGEDAVDCAEDLLDFLKGDYR